VKKQYHFHVIRVTAEHYRKLHKEPFTDLKTACQFAIDKKISSAGTIVRVGETGKRISMAECWQIMGYDNWGRKKK